jgi:UDP-N-acetyl-alpha-D-muramoyl-L-alanyl-L-glutamate epimerase
MERLAPRIKRLRLEECAAERHEIYMSFEAGGRRLTKRYRYSDVDFEDLRGRYGCKFIERLCFHIMALEAIPLASFQPCELDLGPFARFYSDRFERLWRTIFTKAGAQWRYQHDLPDYFGPAFSARDESAAREPVRLEPGPVEALCFCGGGKDSLAAMKLFESAGVAYSSHSYSHPAYGTTSFQFELIESLLDENAAERRHRIEIEADGDGSGPCAETPISIFGALPIALQHGYSWLALGNERSADTPNLRWRETGEFVNHQWGKSLEAELLIGRYIRDELVSNLQCFSALRPMHDPVIFHFLSGFPEAVRRTHSCNRKKPWCHRCAKCAYVGLGFTAYLPIDVATDIVPLDLFDLPENQILFEQLLGLTEHRPFECVGESGETRLAFEICRSKGLRSRAMDLYEQDARVTDAAQLAQTYCEIHSRAHAIPPAIWRMLSPSMFRAGENSLEYIASVCGFDRHLAGVVGGGV